MENKEKNSLDSASFSKDINKKDNKYEDEINMIDLLGIFYKRKRFIFFGSSLPALLVGLILISFPKSYKVTYTYDIGQNRIDYMLFKKLSDREEFNNLITMLQNSELSEKEQTILIETFYGTENLDKMVIKLREKGYDKYAQELSKAKIQLGFRNSLLNITIVGRDQEKLKRISTVVKDNLEAHLLRYFKCKELNNDIVLLKFDMDEIQKDAFNLEMELEGKKATLQKLRSINSADSNTAPQNIVLHIDNIRDNSEFLPWEYQIRAIEANIIYIEEAILSNKKKYDRYNTLRSLSENLLKDTKNNASSFNTAQEFSSFVTDMMHSYRKTELNDFIPAYEQKEENAILKIYPLAETPKVSSIPRDIFKKSFIICAVLLMVTTLIAFLMESVKKTKI